MKLRVTGVLLIVGVGLTIAIGACAGATPTPIPTPTSTPGLTQAQVRDVLIQIAPRFSDLPTGFQLLEPGIFVSNEEAARDSVAAEELLDAYDQFGRLLGYAVAYERGQRLLIATADLYSSPVGAQESFAWLPSGYEDERQYLEAEMRAQLVALLGPQDTSQIRVVFTQLSIQPVGEQSLGGRLTLLVAGTPLTIWLACMLQGAIGGCVGVIDDVAAGSAEELALLKEMELILQLMADRAAASPTSL